MKVEVVHGIHTTEGPQAFPALISPFFTAEGMDTRQHYYGHIWSVAARWKNPRIMERLMDTIPDGSIYVGHSNGCTLGWMMAEAGKRFRGMVMVNPALDRNKVVTKAKFVHVYYNAGDKATAWSRIYKWHPWGDMGRRGPSFKDPRYKNFDTGNVSGMPEVSGHSKIYTDTGNREAWGRFIAAKVRQELKEDELDTFGYFGQDYDAEDVGW